MNPLSALAPLAPAATPAASGEAAPGAFPASDVFRHLVENSPFGIYTVDADFRLAQISAGARKVFQTLQPAIGRDFAEVLRHLWVEPFASEAIAHFRHTLKTGVPYHAPSTVEHRHDIGVVESYDWKIERVMLPDGRYGVVCHFYDLSQRVAFETALQEKETRYRLALNAGRMGSWETDFVAGTRTWSAEGMALFGLDLPDGRGRIGGPDDEYARALHPDDRHLVRHFHEVVDREDSFGAEYRIVRPDGRVLWLAGRGQVVARRPDGRAHRLVSIMADVTERKHAEEVLRTERERLALALEAGRMGVYELDIAADTVWWSRHTYELFGVDPEHFTPTRASITARVHPEDREGFVRRRSEAIEERHSFLYEFRVERGDGTLAWLSNQGEAEYDAAGRPVRTFGVVSDITVQKRLEAALREADRRKDEFLATLAHELRNPLAPIRNSLHLLRHADRSSATAERAQSIMQRQLEHMVRLIDDLMDISRITSGKLELRKEPSVLGAIVGNAVEAARPVLDELGHRLDVALPADPVFVDADPTRLAQVFTNLLNNAAKYTDRGGAIRIDAERQGAEVVVSVSDTGIGIAPEQLPLIFDMFTQVPLPLDRSLGGLGIGLSLVRQLVELHGGRVEARSDGQGRGSVFAVRLPTIPDGQASTATRADAASAPARSTLRILIVDDNRDGADSLAALLDEMGYRVRTAYDGRDGIELAREFEPDVVLLDIGLPGIDGYEVCRRIREEAWARDTVLIAITGWGAPEDRRRSREAGFDLHMVKPVDPEALAERLDRLASPPASR